MTKYIIYKIYWPRRAYYYGKTKGFGKRRNRRLREMQDGTHHNKNVIQAFLKWGIPVIKIVAYAKCDETLCVLEREFLQASAGNKKCLNIQLK